MLPQKSYLYHTMDVKDIYVPFKCLPTPYYKIIKIINFAILQQEHILGNVFFNPTNGYNRMDIYV